MALETNCICPGTSVANDVSPDDLRCRGRRYRTLLRVMMLLGSIAPRPVLTCAIARACPRVPLTSLMDDRSSECDLQASQSRNRKRHQTWAIGLPLNGQATPSVRGKASSQQTEASPVQSGQQNSVHNLAPARRPHQIAASHFLGSFRLNTRSSTSTDLLLR